MKEKNPDAAGMKINETNFSHVATTNGKTVLTARPRGIGGGSFSSWPAWQRERARRLHRHFLSLDAKKGKLLRRIGQLAWWYRERRYRCEPGRRMLLSRNTLIREFYRWREGGRNPEALALKHGGPKKLPINQVIAFGRACVHTGAQSMANVHAGLNLLARLRANRGRHYIFQPPMATVYAYRHALPQRVLKAIIPVFATRRLLVRQEAEAKWVIEAFAAERGQA